MRFPSLHPIPSISHVPDPLFRNIHMLTITTVFIIAHQRLTDGRSPPASGDPALPCREGGNGRKQNGRGR